MPRYLTPGRAAQPTLNSEDPDILGAHWESSRSSRCSTSTASRSPRAPATPTGPRGFGPTVVELEEAYAAHELYRLWVKNRSLYGQHKLWKAAARASIDRGRDQVARLMSICGITGVVRGRHTTITTRRGNEAAARHPDHINRAWNDPTRPDQWWVADFVRHEALFDRVEVKDLHRRAVAAAR